MQSFSRASRARSAARRLRQTSDQAEERAGQERVEAPAAPAAAAKTTKGMPAHPNSFATRSGCARTVSRCGGGDRCAEHGIESRLDLLSVHLLNGSPGVASLESQCAPAPREPRHGRSVALRAPVQVPMPVRWSRRGEHEPRQSCPGCSRHRRLVARGRHCGPDGPDRAGSSRPPSRLQIGLRSAPSPAEDPDSATSDHRAGRERSGPLPRSEPAYSPRVAVRRPRGGAR